MLDDFRNYINKERKERVEWEHDTRIKIEMLQAFRETVEAHKHYKTVNKRVTDKYEGKGSFNIGDFYGSDYTIKGHSHDKFGWIEIKEVVRDREGNLGHPTPDNILATIDKAIPLYKNALERGRNWDNLEAFFTEVSAVAKRYGEDACWILQQAYWKSR